jgi:peptidoglycan/xylan/chitin deacetylase (PgdA/CDA1 family)
VSILRIAAKSVFAVADLLMPRPRGPRILIYHQVGSGRTHEMNVAVDSFRRQIDWLQTHGEIVELQDAIKRRGEPNSQRLFVLTFDDGYADVFVNAFPILIQRELPFTLYLTSGPIENPDHFPYWPGKPLTWAQTREMIDSGLVTVGAHTHTHPDLRSMDVEAVVEELDRSNALIAERSGLYPQHFTYPKGWWVQQAHEAVCSRYLTATIGSGASITESSDLHMLNRVPVQRSDLGPLFSWKMRGGARIENVMRRRLRGYVGP